MRRGLVWSLVGIVLIAVLSLGATILAGHSPLLGLDLKGGVSVVLRPQGTVNTATLQEAVSIIDRRVNGLGVSNSAVARQGNDIVIDLPGIKNSQQALKVLGETATLYFRPVLCEIPMNTPSPTSTSTTPKSSTTVNPTKTSSTKALGPAAALINLTSFEAPASGSSGSATSPSTPASTTPARSATPGAPTTQAIVPPNAPVTAADCSAANAAQLPSTPVQDDTANATVILPYYDNSVRYILGPADMKGNVVANATVVAQTTGGFEVQVTFTNKGASEFDDIAAKRYPYYQQYSKDPAAFGNTPPYQSMEAFELDGVVQSAPTIQAPSFNGVAVISGGTSTPFTQSQASQLALVLKYGSLPVRFVPQSVQTISATIGKDSLRAGLAAGIGGIVVVMLYMLVYYRALGLVVLVGLGIGGAILYSLLTELSYAKNLTLTLAGVTGIIVSIGITVDSYVVYFERLKDEVRSGRTIRQSVERSFARAFKTVLTADLVSFLAALILYIFTIGDVRGFAFTLGVSTLLDVFTAYFFIRPAVILVGRRRSFTEARVFGLSRGLGVRASAREA
jgi:preprotein translocase subunit SecD